MHSNSFLEAVFVDLSVFFLSFLLFFRPDGQTDERADGRTDGRAAGRTDGRLDGWTVRRMGARTVGRTDGRAVKSLSIG